MKKIASFLLAIALMLCIALPCYANDTSVTESNRMTSDVYAKYVGAVEWDDIPVVNGNAAATTDDGYKVSVTGVQSSAVVLRVVPIPSSEAAAWAWFSECIGDDATIVNAFYLCFEDADGNRVDPDGCSISISSANGDTAVFAVATSGNDEEPKYTVTNGNFSLIVNGTHYYLISKNEKPASFPDNNVTIKDPEGGSVEISDKNPATGDTVTITPVPDDGKEVDKVVVKNKDGKEISVTDNGNGSYSYIQPDGKVSVEVTFKDKESILTEEYNVVIGTTLNGNVEVSDMTPTAGQTVTILPKPDSGKVVNTVTVIDENGNPMNVSANGDGSYSYIQPNGNVTINVTFRNKPSSDKAESPATGDNSHIGFWMAAFILSAIALLWLSLDKRRKNRTSD